MNYPNALQTQQERELELTDICKDILANARNELYNYQTGISATTCGKIHE